MAIAAANAAAGAIAGAAGSVAGQGVGVLTGIQDRIDWRGVGLSAISGAVSGYMGPSQSGGFIAGLERGVASNVVTQTIGVAVGLQKKFDWAGVAAAGLQGGVSTLVANSSWLNSSFPSTANPLSPSSLLNAAIPGVAGAVASAAAQSALTRTDFGDNLRALLPDVIGSTIGNALAARAVMPSTEQSAARTPQDELRAQAAALGLDPDSVALPQIVLQKDLRSEDGLKVNGRFYASDNPNDPGVITLDADFVRQARGSRVGSARLLATMQEEIGEAVARAAGQAGGLGDSGFGSGRDAFLATMQGASGDVRFSLLGRTYTTDASSMAGIFDQTFSQDRYLANVKDSAGAYQVNWRENLKGRARQVISAYGRAMANGVEAEAANGELQLQAGGQAGKQIGAGGRRIGEFLGSGDHGSVPIYADTFIASGDPAMNSAAIALLSTSESGRQFRPLTNGDIVSGIADLVGLVAPLAGGGRLARVVAAESRVAEFGSSNTTNYAKTFFAANPALRGKVVVHHAVEQQVLTKFPGVVTKSEVNSLANLRGIPKSLNSDMHLSKIRLEWNRFYKPFVASGTQPTKVQLLQKATEIDARFGAKFNPPLRVGK